MKKLIKYTHMFLNILVCLFILTTLEACHRQILRDTDVDGLLDPFETNTGIWLSPESTGTDPNNSDSDGDGLLDGVETSTGIWHSSESTGTDPNNPDTDGDGLLDSVETSTGIWHSSESTGTDPNNPDTDEDGLLDGVETNTGIWHSSESTGTDPNSPDTDEDGLLDGVETNTNLFSSNENTGTNPLVSDTDKDDLCDGEEVNGAWMIDVVDSKGRVGQFISLALDSKDNVHISYIDDTHHRLKYATNISGSWVTEDVNKNENSNYYTSIAIDALDKVHIAYLKENSRGSTKGDNLILKYATKTGEIWRTEEVDPKVGQKKYTSLALDSQGKAHIAYFGEEFGRLYYATNVTGKWIFKSIGDEKIVGKFSSIAIDSRDRVHIVYCQLKNNKDSGAINYVIKRDSDNWDIKTIISQGDSASHASLALDASDRAHIAYLEINKFCLKYATHALGSWSSETVDCNGKVGMFTSIAIDIHNRIQISYYDKTRGDLKFSTKDSSGKWSNQWIDQVGDVGWHAYLSCDSRGRPHIGYRDTTPDQNGKDDDLKYTRLATSNPNERDTDKDGVVDRVEKEWGTDPWKKDTDNDGLIDGVETGEMRWRSARNTGTDPRDYDSDDDGLSDGFETNTGIWNSPSNTGTDPNLQDTDNDGLLDGVETNTGEWNSAEDVGTDPLSEDTDGDGLHDGEEVYLGCWNIPVSRDGRKGKITAKELIRCIPRLKGPSKPEFTKSWHSISAMNDVQLRELFKDIIESFIESFIGWGSDPNERLLLSKRDDEKIRELKKEKAAYNSDWKKKNDDLLDAKKKAYKKYRESEKELMKKIKQLDDLKQSMLEQQKEQEWKEVQIQSAEESLREAEAQIQDVFLDLSVQVIVAGYFESDADIKMKPALDTARQLARQRAIREANGISVDSVIEVVEGVTVKDWVTTRIAGASIVEQTIWKKVKPLGVLSSFRAIFIGRFSVKRLQLAQDQHIPIFRSYSDKDEEIQKASALIIDKGLDNLSWAMSNEQQIPRLNEICGLSGETKGGDKRENLVKDLKNAYNTANEEKRKKFTAAKKRLQKEKNKYIEHDKELKTMISKKREIMEEIESIEMQINNADQEINRLRQEYDKRFDSWQVRYTEYKYNRSTRYLIGFGQWSGIIPYDDETAKQAWINQAMLAYKQAMANLMIAEWESVIAIEFGVVQRKWDRLKLQKPVPMRIYLHPPQHLQESSGPLPGYSVNVAVLAEVKLTGTDPLDDDTDDDNCSDKDDNCPFIPNSDQIDTDFDGRGNACDEDDDNDGLDDSKELSFGTDPLNSDTDNDGKLDGMDACPLNYDSY